MTASVPNRSTNLATTATTVVALLALASVVRIAPVSDVAYHESRPVVSESSVLRAVVVAVKAARDLFGVDQTVTAVGARNPIDSIPQPAVAIAGNTQFIGAHSIALNERLLDLPPPMA